MRVRRRARSSVSPPASVCASVSGRSARRGRRSRCGAASRATDDVVTVHGGKGTFPLADIHNDDPRDLLYLIAKSIAFPLSNMFLSGNPRERRGRRRDEPDVGGALRQGVPGRRGLPAVPLGARVAAARRCGRRGTSRSCATRAGSTRATGSASWRRPTQIVPFVCGGLGSLHAVALPSFGESQMQSAAVLRRPAGDDAVMDQEAVAETVDEMGAAAPQRRGRPAPRAGRSEDGAHRDRARARRRRVRGLRPAGRAARSR